MNRRPSQWPSGCAILSSTIGPNIGQQTYCVNTECSNGLPYPESCVTMCRRLVCSDFHETSSDTRKQAR